jgi:short-subunit dehydrogenase
MTERGSGHVVNVVSYGGLIQSDPMSLPYDTGQAALAVFTEGLAQQLVGTGVSASIFCPGAKGPRIGQNTRSRGVGRLFGGPDKGADTSLTLEQLASSLIDGMEHKRFLILGDPSEASALGDRWDRVDPGPAS